MGGYTTISNLFNILERDAIGLTAHIERLGNNINSAFPPHNVVKIDDATFRVEIAIAGYNEDEINVFIEDSKLKICGAKHKQEVEYLHRGIAFRDFEKEFTLGQGIEVVEAKLVNGLLTIMLMQDLAEVKKIKKINLNTSKKTFLTEGQKEDIFNKF